MIHSRLHRPQLQSLTPGDTRRWGVVFTALVTLTSITYAGPINTDVAFTPREGGAVLRLQYRYSEADGVGSTEHVNQSIARLTYVYGLRADWSVFLSAPYVNRQVDMRSKEGKRFEVAHDGLGDVSVFIKHRFWQKDGGPLDTQRWAWLTGLNVRSGDSDFTSDSYDPFAGLVFSWRKDRHRFDFDSVYQFNTAGGLAGHDTLRYDAAWSFRIHPISYDEGVLSAIDGVLEINGRYTTDGSHELYLSPGLQFQAERWALETSIQLPVVQDLVGDRPETRYRFVIGLRYHW